MNNENTMVSSILQSIIANIDVNITSTGKNSCRFYHKHYEFSFRLVGTDLHLIIVDQFIRDSYKNDKDAMWPSEHSYQKFLEHANAHVQYMFDLNDSNSIKVIHDCLSKYNITLSI